MDFDLEDEVIHYTARTRTRIPTTLVFDMKSNGKKIGAVKMLGSILKIVRGQGSYTITYKGRNSSYEHPTKTCTISSSPDRIINDLKRVAET